MPLFGPKRSTKKFPTMKNIIPRRAIARIGVFGHRISDPFGPRRIAAQMSRSV